MASGRQDINAPEPTTEKSDPTPVDIRRGKRMVLGTGLVGVVLVLIIIYLAFNH